MPTPRRPDFAVESVKPIDPFSLDERPVVTDALFYFRRRVFESDLGSQELSDRLHSSAYRMNGEYLGEVQAVVDDILSGTENMSTGRLRLMRKLKQLGYDPRIGFPQDMASVPPAEAGSLQDLSSAQRIDLVLETNVRMAHGYAQQVAGNRPAALNGWPAWELVRFYPREIPRGKKKVNGQLVDDPRNAWTQRWADAFAEVNGEGAIENRLIAHKHSPIWQALGDGAGGHTDTLLNPFPPFAFRSGMGWREVRAEEWSALSTTGGSPVREIAGGPPAVHAALTAGQQEVRRVVEGLSPELQAALRKELGI